MSDVLKTLILAAASLLVIIPGALYMAKSGAREKELRRELFKSRMKEAFIAGWTERDLDAFMSPLDAFEEWVKEGGAS